MFEFVEYCKGLYDRGNIIHLSDLPEVYDSEAHVSCFSFSEDVLDYVNNKKSVAGYRGPVHVREFLIDIDYKDDLRVARQYAVRIIDNMIRKFRIPRKSIGAYFSGGKGFHLTVHPTAVGIPDGEAHTNAKYLAQRFAYGIPGGAVDFHVYKRLGLIRLPNSRHKSGKFKVQLSLEAIHTWPIDKILAYAESPKIRFELDPCESPVITDVGVIPEFTKQSYHSKMFGKPCIVAMKCGENIPHGYRDEVALRLVSYMMNVEGNTPEMTFAAMMEWLKKVDNTKLTPEKIQEKINRNGEYTFGCDDHVMQFFCVGCPCKK